MSQKIAVVVSNGRSLNGKIDCWESSEPVCDFRTIQDALDSGWKILAPPTFLVERQTMSVYLKYYEWWLTKD